MKPELRNRIITGCVLFFLFLFVFILAKAGCTGKWMLWGLAVVINGVCAFEFSRTCQKDKVENGRNIFSALVYFLILFSPSFFACSVLLDINICAASLVSIKELSFRVTHFSVLLLFPALIFSLLNARLDIDKGVKIMSELFIGVVLVSLGSASLISLTLFNNSHYLLLWLVFVVAANDTAAYFVGSSINSIKLVPAISPKKSLYGFIAGIVGGVSAGMALSFFFNLADYKITFNQTFLLSLTVVLFAQCGDLCKSLVKRMHNAKDYSSILPGHGGVLDRVDGILAAALALNYYALNF